MDLIYRNNFEFYDMDKVLIFFNCSIKFRFLGCSRKES